MSPTVRTVLAALAGAVLVPLAVAEGEVGLVVLGAVLGAAVAAWRGDRARLRALSDRISALEHRPTAGPVVAPELRVPTPGDGGSAPVPVSPTPTRAASRAAARPAPARPPAWSLDRFPPEVRRAWDFVTGGNPIVRVAVLIVFVGIGLGGPAGGGDRAGSPSARAWRWRPSWGWC